MTIKIWYIPSGNQYHVGMIVRDTNGRKGVVVAIVDSHHVKVDWEHTMSETAND